MPATGLDVCVRDGFKAFNGQRLGLVCNQASIARDYRHVLDHMLEKKVEVACVLGPQHGVWGHTQDNMVEWEGYTDSRTGLRFHSLYGEHREPTDAMLEGVERIVFDVPDVGARYYTFIWTLALSMKKCAEKEIPVTVLDRPNPIGGARVEGPVLQAGFESFVGLHPLPARHGMTVGEVARYFQSHFYPKCGLSVVEMQGWDRTMYQDETDLPWAMPSPNMPTVDTAVVYPGQCLLEGTNLSEGRGTTRPFEVLGAPWIDAYRLTERLDRFALPGVVFRPYQFQPTFQKFSGEVCQGAFVHVVDRRAFRPVLTTVVVLLAVRELWPDCFAWRQPPYEYEEVKLPIDILAGNAWLRESIDALRPLIEIEERMGEEVRRMKDEG
jgi:uncharacterized protein YbbC (DUF1343 family)